MINILINEQFFASGTENSQWRVREAGSNHSCTQAIKANETKKNGVKRISLALSDQEWQFTFVRQWQVSTSGTLPALTFVAETRFSLNVYSVASYRKRNIIEGSLRGNDQSELNGFIVSERAEMPALVYVNAMIALMRN